MDEGGRRRDEGAEFGNKLVDRVATMARRGGRHVLRIGLQAWLLGLGSDGPAILSRYLGRDRPESACRGCRSI